MTAPRNYGADATRELLRRDELVEHLGWVEFYAHIAREMAGVDDAAGADYGLRKMAAHARAAIAVRNHFADAAKSDEASAA